MRDKISKFSSLTLIALIVLSTLSVFAMMPANAVSNTVEAINPIDGTHDFNYTAGTAATQFVINVSVVEVTDLQNWQIKLTWNATLLDFVEISLPSDHVFVGAARTVIQGPPVTNPGEVTWGATYINTSPFPYWTFNGTGRLCQVKLQIKQEVVDPSEGESFVSCSLAFAGHGSDTFLVDGLGHDIVFTEVNGYYSNKFALPDYYPTLYTKPSTVKPDKKGDVFGLEVWIRNLHPGWRVIGLQFSLMWNTTFIEPALGLGGKYFDNGTFFEAFQYGPDGVLYVADINIHARPLPMTPISPDYNYSLFGAILMPDMPPDPSYHAPFPNVGPDGAKVATVYFKAIYDTISPIEDWTWIKFIHIKVDEDSYCMDKNVHLVPFAGFEDCSYRAPMRVLGLSIDLYTQYDAPYGGQYGNMTSDMFGPQQQVELYTIVTYNEGPVQQKLVGYQIFHEGTTQTYNFWREATTNSHGIAHVSFRIPWPCVDPVHEIFGWWYVNATVEVAEQIVVDNLKFWVWWPVEVLSIEPKHTAFPQHKTNPDPMEFTVTYGTYSMQMQNVTVTATIYDELGFFIGSNKLPTIVGWGEYGHEAEMKTYTPWDVTIPLPTNAVVGKGRAFGNAFTDFPWNGGVPYCPEVTNTNDFYITKAP